MIEALKEISALAVATPLGLLVGLLVLALVYQTKKLADAREKWDILSREMWTLHNTEIVTDFSPRAQDAMNQRMKNRSRNPDRRDDG